MYNNIDEVPEYMQEQAEAWFDFEDQMAELIEEEEMHHLHEGWLMEELDWYNHARMMGWE